MEIVTALISFHFCITIQIPAKIDINVRKVQLQQVPLKTNTFLLPATVVAEG